MNIVIYTDGSIIKNPGGVGGWCAIVVSGWRHRILSGHEHDTTNNRMELQAAIEGLRSFRSPRDITLYSDSEYVIKGFTEGRVEKWAANNWTKKKYGKPGTTPIPNADLWRQIADLDLYHRITWKHHRGQHRSPTALEGDESWMATAHQHALSEARLAHHAREKGFTGYDTPKTAEERLALAELIQGLPTPPDPPEVERATAYAVYQRVGLPRKLTFRGPLFIPMEPSKTGDGGEADCHKAARTMNKTDDTKEGKKYQGWSVDRYVVMPFGIEGDEPDSEGRRFYHLTEDQFNEFRREDDRALRSVSG